MKRTCYQLQENNRITAVSCQNAIPREVGGTGAYWIEIESASADELSAELTALDLHPLIIEDCLTPGYSTMIDRYETAVYFELPINQPQPYGRISYISIIFMAGLLITIRQGDLPNMGKIAEELQSETDMNYFIAQELTAVRQLRDWVDELTHAFETDATAVKVESVAALKRRVSRLEASGIADIMRRNLATLPPCITI